MVGHRDGVPRGGREKASGWKGWPARRQERACGGCRPRAGWRALSFNPYVASRLGFVGTVLRNGMEAMSLRCCDSVTAGGLQVVLAHSTQVASCGDDLGVIDFAKGTAATALDQERLLGLEAFRWHWSPAGTPVCSRNALAT
jgi:hypothetical protein